MTRVSHSIDSLHMFLDFKLSLLYHFTCAIMQLYYEAILIILMGDRLVGANDYLRWIKVGERDPCTFAWERRLLYTTFHPWQLYAGCSYGTYISHTVYKHHIAKRQRRSPKTALKKNVDSNKRNPAIFLKVDIRAINSRDVDGPLAQPCTTKDAPNAFLVSDSRIESCVSSRAMHLFFCRIMTLANWFNATCVLYK